MEITAYGLRYRVRAHEKGFFPEDAPRPVQPGCPPPASGPSHGTSVPCGFPCSGRNEPAPEKAPDHASRVAGPLTLYVDILV